MEWIINNKEWIFSGAGVVIIAAVIKYFWSKKSSEKSGNSISQSMGDNSKGNFTRNEQKINIDSDKS